MGAHEENADELAGALAEACKALPDNRQDNPHAYLLLAVRRLLGVQAMQLHTQPVQVGQQPVRAGGRGSRRVGLRMQ